MMIANKLLGDAVKEERLRRNLSQNKLAEYAQTSLRTISDIETGKANPRLDTLVPLANYLNISIDSIILQNKTTPEICRHLPSDSPLVNHSRCYE
ncbi:MAG: helix-turn-helix domain-containing protein [Lachnospiraceae bacterium]